METQASMSFLYEGNRLFFSIKKCVDKPYALLYYCNSTEIQKRKDFPRKNLIFLNVSLTVFFRKKVMIQSL